jgi:LysR family hydrogen peroxide-inducible transcriptional activator
MELDLFESFLAVAEARSFSRAAKAAYSTQSTLSRQISRLEKELDTRLFDRHGRHVELTFNGQLLLPLAQAIVGRTHEAITLMREQAGAGASTVRFGAVGNVFALLLTPILVPFLATYPRLAIDLVEKDDAALEEAVISGELDCAVITPWGSARTASQHLYTEEILLVVPSDHRFAGLPAVKRAMLAHEPLLLPRATMNAGNVVADALRRAGVEPRSSQRANYPELTKALVRRGLGVAPMPVMLVEPLEGLVAIPFDEPITRDLVFIYPRDRPSTAAVRTLAAQLQKGLVSGPRPGA